MGTVYNARMPELPEVQSIRCSLEKHLVGRFITRVVCRRRDVIAGSTGANNLLAAQRIVALDRHGKQLALLCPKRALVIQLGMSGSLRWVADPHAPIRKHDHVLWHLDDASSVRFHDPRRFGGVTPLPDHASLQQRWRLLGPDALTCTPGQLHARLNRTQRCIKAALLDQQNIAGLGNIYVDELLYTCRMHPLTCASQLTITQLSQMVRAMRRILKKATEAGGSTIRDYVNGMSQKGAYQYGHQVYGRAGQPCCRCRQLLVQSVVAGRTTVFCPQCQGVVDNSR